MKDQWLLKNAFFFFYLLFLFFFSITVNYNSILNKLGTPKNDKAKTSKTTLWSQFPHLINSETTVAPPTQYEKGQWFSKIGEWKLNTERVKKKIKKKKKKQLIHRQIWQFDYSGLIKMALFCHSLISYIQVSNSTQAASELLEQSPEQ